MIHNIEVLQVAIGDIHPKLMESLMKDLAKTLHSFYSKLFGVRLNIDLKSNMDKLGTGTGTDTVNVNNCEELKCKNGLSKHKAKICALRSHLLNDKQDLASVSCDNMVLL